MTAKDWVVFAFWALAVAILLVGGFDAFHVQSDHPHWNLFDLAVASFLTGYIIRTFVATRQS